MTLLKGTAALYSIVSVHIVSWIVLDLFLLHHPWACTVWQSTLLRFSRKESKIDGGVSVAVNMHSLFQKLTNNCQIHVKSGQSYLGSHWKESSVVRYVFGNFCYWYHVAQYYLLHLGRCSLLSEEEGSSGCCLVLKTRLACSQNKTRRARWR